MRSAPFHPLIDRLADAFSVGNPQLWREVKGRVQPRSVIITTVVSGMVQLGLWRFIYLSHESNVEQPTTHAIAQSMIWLDLHHGLTCLGLFLLLGLGNYWIVRDWAAEDRTGMLTLLRLSPQPSDRILIGKLLGVPILLYWAIAIAFPLHVGTGLACRLRPWDWFYNYGLVLSSCSVTFIFTTLYALGWGKKARVGYILFPAGLIYCLVLPSLNMSYWDYRNFLSAGVQAVSFLPVSGGLWFFNLSLISCLSLLTGLLWHACRKSFHYPPVSG